MSFPDDHPVNVAARKYAEATAEMARLFRRHPGNDHDDLKRQDEVVRQAHRALTEAIIAAVELEPR